MSIDKKTLTIAGLTLSAALLLLANFYQQPARADLAVGDRDYQLITARAANGGDDLFVMDNRSGLMAAFQYDPNIHNLRYRAITAVPDIFNAH